MERIPWNKGKKGLQVAWNKGLTKEDPRVKKYSEQSSETRKGNKLSKEHKEKIRNTLKGRIPWNVNIKTSEEVKQKIRKSTFGKKNHFYGKTHSKKTKRQISKSRKGKYVGKDHPTCKFYLNNYEHKITKLYYEGYSAKKISRKYNVSNTTILVYLRKWGTKIRKSFYGQGTIMCKDGHKVYSYPELLIDSFLFFNGIEHKSNRRILETKYMYDFYIPKLSLYIEYWGIEKSQTYCERKDKKLKIYKENNLNLLSIRPNEDINKKLGFLIPLCATKQKTLMI
jgi:hypothetical protein